MTESGTNNKLTFLFAAILLVFSSTQAFSKDITEMVINNTPLDEQINLFCLTHCLGNERKGTLKSITIKKVQDNLYTVRGKAYLRNRQVAKSPYEFTVFDKIVIVNSTGTLNPETCELVVDDVNVENDFQDIVSNLLKSQSDVIGKKLPVPECRKFLN